MKNKANIFIEFDKSVSTFKYPIVKNKKKGALVSYFRQDKSEYVEREWTVVIRTEHNVPGTGTSHYPELEMMDGEEVFERELMTEQE